MINRKSSICAAAVLGVSSVAMAQTGPELLISPFRPNTSFELTAGALYGFDTETDNADADFQMTYLEARGRAMLDRGHIARPVGGFDLRTIRLDTDDPALPSTMGDYSVGVGFGILSEAGWTGGLTLALGYAATAPFGDGDGYYGKATIVFGKEDVWDGWALGIALSYDGNRSILPDVPLPGFVLSKRFPEYDSVIRLGLPVSGILWTPDPKWEIQLDYVLPDFLDARVTYFASEQVGLYIAVSSRTDAFKYDALEDNLDRLIFTQKRAELGLTWRPMENCDVVLAGGYAFDQEFTAGFDTRNDDKIAEIDDAPYARLEINLRF
ncbi:MAG TPA: hypothetical protein PKB10_08830 [Tepidisphaeraceae bacterium]|nr:hypothetical protein [Tepidisphaeraceae bacterium]